jgi:hypothetical protein
MWGVIYIYLELRSPASLEYERCLWATFLVLDSRIDTD